MRQVVKRAKNWFRSLFVDHNMWLSWMLETVNVKIDRFLNLNGLISLTPKSPLFSTKVLLLYFLFISYSPWFINHRITNSIGKKWRKGRQVKETNKKRPSTTRGNDWRRHCSHRRRFCSHTVGGYIHTIWTMKLARSLWTTFLREKKATLRSFVSKTATCVDLSPNKEILHKIFAFIC